MVQRQHGKQPVLRGKHNIRRNGIYIIRKVCVGNHNTLGSRSGSACKDEHCKSIRVDFLVHKAGVSHAGKYTSFLHNIVKAHEAFILLVKSCI